MRREGRELLVGRGSKAGGWGVVRIQASGSARLQGSPHSIPSGQIRMGCVAGGLSLRECVCVRHR